MVSPSELLHWKLFLMEVGEAQGKARGTLTVKPKRIHEEHTVTSLPDKDPITSCHINQKIPVILCPTSFCHFSMIQEMANTYACEPWST